MSEIRLNRLTGEWVIIAPERAKRGGNLVPATAPTDTLGPGTTCPFCPGNEAVAGEERYRDDGDHRQWAVRSIVNKFSVLSTSGQVAGAGSSAEAAGNVN